MKKKSYLFSSESVSEGHPDKVADQISDAVLDACLKDDKYSRVACETLATTGLILLSGEITTKSSVSFIDIARIVVKDIGYNKAEYGLDADSMAVLLAIDAQSSDIAQGIGNGGAGDQGMMFGYACNETPEYMPAPIMHAHAILKYASKLRKTHKDFSWLRPDAKCQITIQYENDIPAHIDTVVLSHQHDSSIRNVHNNTQVQKLIKEIAIESIIKPVLKKTKLLSPHTKYIINPTGRFEKGGPQADTGLTGRKIIVDTYGGMGRHGGGAFSGKDPSKVDRSAAYMARYIAKNIVAAKLATRCEVQLAYAIGRRDPVSIMINTFNTGKVAEDVILRAVHKTFPDLTPNGIIKSLDLLRPIYQQTAAYGHFGRKKASDLDSFTWEKIDKTTQLQRNIS